MFFPLFLLITAQLAWASRMCTPANSSQYSSKPIVAASWYTSWHSDDFPLQNVSWSKYTSVIYAFALTTPNPSIIGLQDSDKQLLPQFVQTAHQNGVRAILSVGGWTGSIYFSSAVATDANRTAFANAIMGVVSQYNLDGVEFDWEYPNYKGIGCNVMSANDSANFLLFLQTLREQNGAQNLTFSAAVTPTPFADSTGAPMSDVSGFAEVLDYIEVMNYDRYGHPNSTTVGPNAPFNDSCTPTPKGSAVSAVKAWTAARFPANKIILGVASYGHSFHVDKANAFDGHGNLKLDAPFDKSQQPKGDKWDDVLGGVDVCGNPNPAGYGGNIDFWGLIDGGFLTTNGTTAPRIDYTFDPCSETPFVYNPSSQVMVSYDDATSFAIKGKFISEENLAGFAMWEAGGDSRDILLDAIRTGISIGC